MNFAEFYLIYVLVTTGILLGGVFWWFYRSRVKVGYKAVFYRRLGGKKIKDGVKEKTWYNPTVKKEQVLVPAEPAVYEGGAYVEIGEKEIKADTLQTSFRKKNFDVDFSMVGFRKFGWTKFCFDFDNTNQITFGGELKGGNGYLADIILESGLIQSFVLRLKQVGTFGLVVFAIIAVVSGLTFAVGLLASPYILPHQAAQNVTAVVTAKPFGVP